MKSDSSAPHQGPPTIRSIPKHTITVRHASSIDDDNSDEEMGRLIYQSIHTARARARHAQRQGLASSTATHEHLPDQNQSSNSLGHMSISDITLSGAGWNQTCSAHGESLVLVKRKIAADEGNGPAPPTVPRKTCHAGHTTVVQEGGVCISQSTNVTCKRCSHGVCTNQVANRGTCVRHGRNRKTKCSHEECTNISNRKSFEERIEDLRSYKEKHGHLNVRTNEDKSLADWCSRMRHARANPDKSSVKLDEKRIASLDALGFDWRLNIARGEFNCKSFEERIEDLRSYKEKHGHLNVRTN